MTDYAGRGRGMMGRALLLLVALIPCLATAEKVAITFDDLPVNGTLPMFTAVPLRVSVKSARSTPVTDSLNVTVTRPTAVFRGSGLMSMISADGRPGSVSAGPSRAE